MGDITTSALECGDVERLSKATLNKHSRREDVFRSIIGNDTAFINKHDAVYRTMKDILNPVLDDDYCLSSFLVKVIDKLYSKFSSCRIKCGKRLIEEEHRNIVHKYTGKCNTLFLSS